MPLISPQFLEFYSLMYGERWPSLLSALEQKENQVARPNGFSDSQVNWNGEGEIPRSTNGSLSYYVMDPASILAAEALEVKAGEKVLDMCAAPGGKALILAEANPGELILNELSQERRSRLMKVIQQYIPREKRDHIFVTGKEGGKFSHTHREYFDKILVDAPCSGERHLLKNQKEMKDWSPSRTKKLAHRQYALLTSALLACKKGGRIVYSTCSVSSQENDAVIEELLRKKKGMFKVLPNDKKDSKINLELTRFGTAIFPDKSSMGPIYFSILEKL
jgi:5-methylcytosine rRNA methyltransferase NSUN4